MSKPPLATDGQPLDAAKAAGYESVVNFLIGNGANAVAQARN
jgi:hypothetical protein